MTFKKKPEKTTSKILPRPVVLAKTGIFSSVKNEKKPETKHKKK